MWDIVASCQAGHLGDSPAQFDTLVNVNNL